MTTMRIVSLLPGATEIVCALGLSDALVGVSHECDYPPEVRLRPVVTRSRLPSGLTSGEIDAAVRAMATADAHSLYYLDRDLLAELAPDLLLTQQLCGVCAIAEDDVRATVAGLPNLPRILSLDGMTLEGVFADITALGGAAHVPVAARLLLHRLRARVERVRASVEHCSTRPRVAFLEWLDPLFCAGHWTPELIALAGGIDPIGCAGEPSRRIEWQEVSVAAPDVLFIACCGYDEARARQDLPLATALPDYDELPCALTGRVHVLDGNAYFSRPGPRLVDGLELLATLLHPELYNAHS
jgi:iron complex transport system substrate-binding protein